MKKMLPFNWNSLFPIQGKGNYVNNKFEVNLWNFTFQKKTANKFLTKN